MNEQFQRALPIIETIKRHGYEAYFVGGAVRDYLLQRPIGDIDIATSAHPSDIMRIFPKTVPVGLKHGTVMVISDGIPYEVTTFRKEGKYEDYRRPSEVTFVRSLYEDLQRRDFTINAIAMDEKGRFIDPFGGMEALKHRVIHTVGRAEERFREDALRMMRALRFVSQLGFSLSKETEEAISEYGHLLKNIAVERITIEFEKLLLGPFRAEALRLLVHTRLFVYLPALAEREQALLQLCTYRSPLSHRLKAWVLFAYVANFDKQSLKQWKLSNELLRDIFICVQALHEIKNVSDWTIARLYKYGEVYIEYIESIRSIVHDDVERTTDLLRRWESLPIRERKQLAVNGEDLLRWFARPRGRWIAEAIERIEHAVLHGEVSNEKEAIKEWLTCNQKHENSC